MNLTEIIRLVADYYGLTAAQLAAQGRSQPLLTIRKLICALCWQRGFKDADIAGPLNRERSTVHVMRHRFNPDHHPALRADWDWLSGKSNSKPATHWLLERAKIAPTFNRCECGTVYEYHNSYERAFGCPTCRQSYSDLELRRSRRLRNINSTAHQEEYAFSPA